MHETDEATGRGDSAATERRRRFPWAVASLALSMLLASLGVSIANVALPVLTDAFSAPFQAVQWVVLAYLLAMTASIVGAGRLADQLGHRRVLLAGIVLFTLASALSGLAPDLWLLIVARGVQGVGAAILMALSVALVRESVAKDRTGSAMGLLGTMSAIGTALGPSLGGLLISGFGWRAIFLVMVPLGVIAALIAARSLPAPRPQEQAPAAFDLRGTALLALTLVGYALSLTYGNGRFGTGNAALLLATVFGAVLLVLSLKRAAAPLIPLEAFRDAAFSGSLVMNALVATVMMATLVVGPFYLSRSLGLDTALVGLVMSAGPVISAVTGYPSGRLVDRWGVSCILTLGLGLMLAGCMALASVPAGFGAAGYIAAIAVLTPGYQFFQAANNTAVMMDVPAARRGVVSGLLSLARNLGLITGASFMGAVFALATGAPAISAALPETVSVGMRMTFSVAAALMLAALAVAYGSSTLRLSLKAVPDCGNSRDRSGR